MTGWPSQKISELCEIRPSKSDGTKGMSHTDRVSFVPMSDLPVNAMYLVPKDSRELGDVEGSYTHFADNDVLLAKITPCFENGKLAIARGLTNGVGFGSSEYVVLRPSAKLLSEYLYWFLHRQEFRDEGARVMTGAVGHRRIPKSFVEDYAIPVPPLDVQRELVTYLNDAQERIRRATAIAVANADHSEALFWSYLNRAFDRRDEWSRFQLGTRVRFVDYRGKTPPKRDVGIRLITAKNVKMGHINREPEEFIDPQAYRNWMTRGFPKRGDVLFTTEAPLGNIAQLDSDETVVIGQRLITMQPDEQVLKPGFLKFFLMTDRAQTDIRKLATGATVQGIKARLLKQIEIAAPPLPTQDAISEELEQARAQTRQLRAGYVSRISTLASLKEALLSEAFLGQLRLPVEGKSRASTTTQTPEFAARILALAYDRHASQQRGMTFGRVKAQKTLHLTETIGKVDLGRRPIKDAAGPNDFPHMLKAEQWAKESNFFEFVPRPSGGYDFKKLSKFNKLSAASTAILQPFREGIDRAVNLLIPMDSEVAEVFATVHAAWNNLLIDGKEATDAAILREARENWHPSKLAISESKFRTAIQDIRQRGLAPDGTGKPVRGQESLF